MLTVSCVAVCALSATKSENCQNNKKEISELLNGKKKMGICISKTEPRMGHDVYIFSMYICPVLQKRNSKVDSKSSFQNNTFSKRSSRWCIQSSK